MKELAGLKALVTGGSRGIGAAISQTLFNSGAQVTILGKTAQSFEQFQNKYGKGCEFVKLNLQNTSEVEAFSRNLEFDILINNAGINIIDLTGDIEIENWAKVISVNLTAPMILIRGAVEKMLQNNFGRILNVSSIFGSLSRSKRACYSASKAGLEGLTRALALDYAGKNILANCIAPGFIDTDLTREILSPNEIEGLVAQVPVGRLGSPEEIARLTQFLVSPKNTFITGQTVTADGGFSIK